MNCVNIVFILRILLEKYTDDFLPVVQSRKKIIRKMNFIVNVILNQGSQVRGLFSHLLTKLQRRSQHTHTHTHTHTHRGNLIHRSKCSKNELFEVKSIQFTANYGSFQEIWK